MIRPATDKEDKNSYSLHDSSRDVITESYVTKPFLFAVSCRMLKVKQIYLRVQLITGDWGYKDL